MLKSLLTTAVLLVTSVQGSRLLSALSGSSAVSSNGTGPTTTTQYGTVLGTYQHNQTVAYYGGLPFAVPPVGQYRFTYPVDWSAPLNLTVNNTYYNATYQRQDCLSLSTTLGGVEDCLYLDMWVPTTPAPADGFPVLVYFPGGGFHFTAYQNGSNFIGNGGELIVIYVRSRIGPFGFLAHPGLSVETSPIQSSGNYGLADFISGLRWIQSNIHSFGGNNQSVTISGESAGAISICFILTSPLATGLFRAAVMMSGGCDNLGPELPDQEQLGFNIVQQSSCAINSTGTPTQAELTQQAQCFRNLSSAEIWEAMLAQAPTNTSSAFTFTYNITRPFTDGYVVPTLAGEAWKTGQFNVVPTITGDCNDEGMIYLVCAIAVCKHCANYIYNTIGGLWAIDPLWSPPTVNFSLPETYADFYAANPLSPIYSTYNLSNTPAELYYGPSGPFGQYAAAHNLSQSVGAYLAQQDLITTGVFACPVRRQARAEDVWGGNQVWTYDFKHIWDTDPFAQIGAIHASDLPFWFDQPAAQGSYEGETSFYPAQQTLSVTMQQYLVNFVTNLNPNNNTGVNLTGSNTTYWPTYNASTGLYLEFGNGTINNTALATITEPFNSSCAIWDLYVPLGNFTVRCAPGYTLVNNATWNETKCVPASNGVTPTTGLYNTSINAYGLGANGATTSSNSSTSSYYGSSTPATGADVSGNTTTSSSTPLNSAEAPAVTASATVTSAPA